MAVYLQNFCEDCKVYLDLYMDQIRMKTILTHIRRGLDRFTGYDADDYINAGHSRIHVFTFDTTACQEALKIHDYDNGKPFNYKQFRGPIVTDWKVHNQFLWSVAGVCMLQNDIIRYMITSGLSIVEMACICLSSQEYMRSYGTTNALRIVGDDGVTEASRIAMKAVTRSVTGNRRQHIEHDDGKVFQSRIESMLADYFDKESIAYAHGGTDGIVHYTWTDAEGDHVTNTTPDFLFGKVALYIDGYTHDLDDTKERDMHQNVGLSALGYSVVRIPAKYLGRDAKRQCDVRDDAWQVMLAMVKKLIADNKYDFEKDVAKLAKMYDAFMKKKAAKDAEYHPSLTAIFEKRVYKRKGRYWEDKTDAMIAEDMRFHDDIVKSMGYDERMRRMTRIGGQPIYMYHQELLDNGYPVVRLSTDTKDYPQEPLPMETRQTTLSGVVDDYGNVEIAKKGKKSVYSKTYPSSVP